MGRLQSTSVPLIAKDSKISHVLGGPLVHDNRGAGCASDGAVKG
jgi:hypothetical protein